MVNDVLNQLQLLIQGSAPKLIEVTDQSKVAIPFVPGERYTAKVQEQIANGRFLVLIRDQKLDLNLPSNTQPGQNVELRFVAANPRLTFVLAEGLPTPGLPQTPVNLSDGSRYLNALLDRVNDLATRQAQTSPSNQSASTSAQGPAAALISGKPILAGAPPPLAQFVALLKETITKSGLFYESHQAQWAAGERPLTDLLREPQGRLSESRAFTAAQQAALAQPGATMLPKLDLLIPSPQAPANLSSSHEPVHPQTAPLVQQQLESLDQRHLLWQGQVWSGQEMRWQIEERAAREGEQDVEREWQTRLDLSLPHLGQVSAVLKVTPQGIRVELAAPTPDTVNALQSASPLLSQGMERAGLRLIEVQVKAGSHDGPN